MAVKSIGDYPPLHRDKQEGFGPVQILYVCWEGHLLFAAPCALVGPPEAPLEALIDGQLKGILSPDPDASQINWGKVEWIKNGQPVKIDLTKTLEQNGLRHKDQLLFRTPGLNTVCAA